MAERGGGSSPRVFIRLNVSRHEIPASTRIFVQALATTAQFPRLPLASIETQTPMHAAYAPSLWIGSNFLVSRYLGDDPCGHTPLGCPSQGAARCHQNRLSASSLALSQVIHHAPHDCPAIGSSDSREKCKIGTIHLPACWPHRENQVSDEFGQRDENSDHHHPPPRPARPQQPKENTGRQANSRREHQI